MIEHCRWRCNVVAAVVQTARLSSSKDAFTVGLSGLLRGDYSTTVDWGGRHRRGSCTSMTSVGIEPHTRASVLVLRLQMPGAANRTVVLLVAKGRAMDALPSMILGLHCFLVAVHCVTLELIVIVGAVDPLKRVIYIVVVVLLAVVPAKAVAEAAGELQVERGIFVRFHVLMIMTAFATAGLIISQALLVDGLLCL